MNRELAGAVAGEPARTPAIVTPFIDGLLSGGLALTAMTAVLVYLWMGGEVSFSQEDWLTLAVLVNGAHFMASYRVLYSSKDHLRKYPWATLGVPIIFSGVILVAALSPDASRLQRPLFFINTIYLAWHYAGQTWGMIATYSRIAGVSYTPSELFRLRAGPRSLMAFHVLLVLAQNAPPARWISHAHYMWVIDSAVNLVIAAIVLSAVIGASTLFQLHQRGRSVPRRAIFAWAAYFVWYPFWIFVPSGLFWLQIAHALQYLSFPLRIDLNRFDVARQRSTWSRRQRTLGTYLILVVSGAVFLFNLPLLVATLGEGWYSTPKMRQLFSITVSAISIHHYFVDGAIWHLREASVRRSLLGHLGNQTRGQGEFGKRRPSGDSVVCAPSASD